MKNVPDAMLRQMLMQMTQAGQAGTPEFILAAGELQGRKEARQQTMMNQGNPRPVIADLLMGDAMPPQMPVLPENAGGIAALPAPNMEGIATLAGGGLVAFSNGGRPFDTTRRILEEMGLMTKDGEYIRPYRTEREKRLVAEQQAQAAAQQPTIDRADAMKQFRQADNAGLAALAQMPPQTTQGVGAAPAAGNQPTVTRVDTPPAAGTAGVGAAPPAPPTIDYKDAFEKAGATAKELLGTAPTMPEAVTTKNVKEAVEADRKLFEELGIADPTKLRRDQIEAEMKEAKSDKEQAGWMRLAEFGFNWASQNGPALQAAAKAGAAVAPGLISDLKELKKTERAQKRELAGLAALDAQAQRDMTAKARDRLDAKYESGLRRVDEHRKNIATLSASIAANAISSQTQLTTTGMTTAASRDVAKISADATLAKLAEQMAETETKNIVDAAKDLLVRRQDYVLLAQDPAAMDKAFKDAIRSVKQGRALANTTVTKSGT